MTYREINALEQVIETAIEEGNDFEYLNETSIYCNGVLASDETFDFYLDIYSERRRKNFDVFSAKLYALRKAHDYIFYEDSLTKDMERIKFKVEIGKTKKSKQNIPILMKKYLDMHCEEEKREETRLFLNNLYFEFYAPSKSHEIAKKGMISFFESRMRLL